MRVQRVLRVSIFVCFTLAVGFAPSGCKDDEIGNTTTEDVSEVDTGEVGVNQTDTMSDAIDPLIPAYEARSESLLAIDNPNSTVDLLAATEAGNISVGDDDNGNFLLEATEASSGRTIYAVAADAGSTMLLDAVEMRVRFTPNVDGPDGTLTILEANEAGETIIAEKNDFVLEATETTEPKQSRGDPLDALLRTAIEDWESGRWSALLAGVLALADAENINVLAISEAFADLEDQLRSMQQLLAEADPNNELPEGVESRPNFYRVPDGNDAFGTASTYDELLNDDRRAAFASFLSSVAAELRRFAAGEEDAWAFLPPALESYDGREIDTQSEKDELRFFLVSGANAVLSLTVRDPDGANQFDAETVSFEDAADGVYRASATYSRGEDTVSYEILVYLNGRIINRLVGRLDTPGDVSSELRILIGDSVTEPNPQDATDPPPDTNVSDGVSDTDTKDSADIVADTVSDTADVADDTADVPVEPCERSEARPFGCDCLRDSQCDSSLCLDSNQGQFCSQACLSDADCEQTPRDLSCGDIEVTSGNFQRACVELRDVSCLDCDDGSGNPNPNVCAPEFGNDCVALNDGYFCTKNCNGNPAVCPAGTTCQTSFDIDNDGDIDELLFAQCIPTSNQCDTCVDNGDCSNGLYCDSGACVSTPEFCVRTENQQAFEEYATTTDSCVSPFEIAATQGAAFCGLSSCGLSGCPPSQHETISSCTSSQLRTEIEFEVGCSDCYGDISVCIFANCFDPCALETTDPQCLACRAANGCDAAFEACAGTTLEDNPCRDFPAPCERATNRPYECPCETNAQCGSNQCAEGDLVSFCTTTCSGNSDCDPGYSCVPDSSGSGTIDRCLPDAVSYNYSKVLIVSATTPESVASDKPHPGPDIDTVEFVSDITYYSLTALSRLGQFDAAPTSILTDDPNAAIGGPDTGITTTNDCQFDIDGEPLVLSLGGGPRGTPAGAEGTGYIFYENFENIDGGAPAPFFDTSPGSTDCLIVYELNNVPAQAQEPARCENLVREEEPYAVYLVADSVQYEEFVDFSEYFDPEKINNLIVSGRLVDFGTHTDVSTICASDVF